MIEISVYNDIANKKDGIWLSMCGVEDAVFSADLIKSIFEENKNEKEFKFNFHCDGGSVTEGLAIYDIIRNSGKTIYTNIEGGCHSMATVLLLSAPKENRTANRNCRALIHEVRGATYDYQTAEEFRALADDIEQEQNAILDIYAERTGSDREELETLMKEEKQRTASELLDYGFINSINTYSTNLKNAKMSKETKQGLLNKATDFLKRVTNMLADVVNYDFTDDDGNVLFSTESDNDTLEVGMTASPDGTFEIPSGVIVTIADGVITEITVPNADEEVEELREENKNLKNALTEAQALITDLKNSVQSTHQPKGRVQTPKSVTGGNDDAKNSAREKLKQARGGK